MKNKTIHLGKSDAPATALADAPEGEPTKDVHAYPELRITNHDDPGILDMPDEGTALVHHRMIHRSETTQDGKKQHSVTLQIKSIQPHGHRPGKKLPGAKEDEEAVEKGL